MKSLCIPFLTALVTAALVAGACYPTEFETTSETDVVLTIRDPDRDYSVNRTFVITSTVFDLTDLLEPTPTEELSDEFDELILDTIRDNMLDLGYREVQDLDAETPDVGVFVGKVVSETWVIYNLPGWNPWYPVFPPVFYPPFPIVGQYRFGTLFFPIIEIGDRSEEDPVIVQWLALSDGLLSTSESTNASRVVDAIDQAFEQSPYLRLEVPQ
ncbi:MAG: DUF4136 domain-containing protein [Myxococcota bacterium]